MTVELKSNVRPIEVKLRTLLGGGPVLATGIMTSRFPVAATEYLEKNPGAVHDEVGDLQQRIALHRFSSFSAGVSQQRSR